MWELLPNDIIWKILYMADLPIDTRLALGMKPRRIHSDILNDLSLKLQSHEGYIYNTESKSLHVFLHEFHIIMRPIEMSFRTDVYTVFNEDEEYFSIEIVYPDGRFYSNIIDDTFIVKSKILLKE